MKVYSKKIGITNWMKGGTMYDQREIVLMPFPYSDLTGSKKRPALIVSNGKVNKSQDRICCLITSNKPEDGVLINKKDFEKGELPFKSWIKPNRIFSISEEIIVKSLCKISEEFHKQIIKSINEYID